MPGFVRSKSDEKKWSRAKRAVKQSKHKDESGFEDQDYALSNKIFHNMKKNDIDDAFIDKAIKTLEKARRKLSDEHDPEEQRFGSTDDYQDEDYGPGMREFDPDQDEEAQMGEQWLKDHDKDKDPEAEEEEPETEDDHEEFEPHDESMYDDQDVSPGKPQANAQAQKDIPDYQSEEPRKTGRFNQPSDEDIRDMRSYTRPWVDRARDMNKLQAEASKNPVLHQQGKLVEARNMSHKDRHAEYQKLLNSPDYKNADPMSQMDMEDNFQKEWTKNNPEHIKQAIQAHGAAAKEGAKAKDIHAAAKDAQIRHTLSGGQSNPSDDYMSSEEALQGITGGGRDEDSGHQASVKQDRATAFANQNQDFINQYAKDYNKKAKSVNNIDDMMDYDEGSKKDISRILGEGPSKNPKVEKFFEHYHPLIGMTAHRTLKQMNLDPKSPDIDMGMLHEAGMHGLMQAINDYDSKHPSKASFSTHASNKMRGLMQTALKSQDQVPTEIRQAQKKFKQNQQQGAPAPAPTMAQPAAPKPSVDPHSVISSSSHPEAANMADRLKRVNAQRVIVRKPKGTP